MWSVLLLRGVELEKIMLESEVSKVSFGSRFYPVWGFNPPILTAAWWVLDHKLHIEGIPTSMINQTQIYARLKCDPSMTGFKFGFSCS